MKLDSDVAVVGSGPAGLALAAEVAERGLDVVCVAPAPERTWTRAYGVWAHEESLVPPESVAHRYPTPRVWLDDGPGLTLPRGYARLSTPRLQRHLLQRAERAGVRFVDARVTAIEPTADALRLDTPAGSVLRSRLIVDASGASSSALRRRGDTVDAHQTAYGMLVEVGAHPYAAGEMAFMDFRHAPGGDAAAAPSFLYALPIDATHLFVEETALVRSPAMPIEELRGRLHERLGAMGLEVRATHEEERCSIPMGLALPIHDQPIVGFGAAASMVHPATGYQLASALRLAPVVARAITEGLEHEPAHGAARAAWQAIWPVERRRLWALYRFGMAALCTFDLAKTRQFFRAFFALESADWQRYLDATASPAELASIMARLFWGAPLATQWSLLRHGVGAGRTELWRATAFGGVA